MMTNVTISGTLYATNPTIQYPAAPRDRPGGIRPGATD
jgi:hypothetical protein